MEKNGVKNLKSLHSSIGRAGNSKLLFVIGSNPIGDINMIVEIDRLIHPLRDLGDKYVVAR